MVVEWLRGVREGLLQGHRRRQLARPRRRAGSVSDRSLPALVQLLEPRQLLSATPVGTEFQVNTFTTLDQSETKVAMDADGDFVVTWTSNGQDGSGFGIYAQRYNAAGVAQGSEFRVNSFTTDNQQFSAVAMDADGDFVVTWTSFGQDGSSFGVYAQRYNAAGVAQGSEFQVNTFTTGSQIFSTVAMDADGDFVVTWSSNGQDGSGYGIYAQQYNAAGVAQGGEFRVNSFTTNSQRFSAVAMDADGDFVVTWESANQDGDGFGVYAQRYNAAGVAQGGEFQVNTFTTSQQLRPTVAMDAGGDFVVTWSSSGQDGSDYGIYAQRYNAAGVAQGSEFQVNTFTTGRQRFSTVALDADGDFIVTWASDGQDGSLGGVYAQRYNAAGVAEGGEFRVNTFTLNNQRNSTVAMDADGDFVVAWQSYTQDGGDYGIYAQRYDDVGPDNADDAGPIITGVLIDGDVLFENEVVVPPPSSITVLFSEALNATAGGPSGASSVLNLANWALTKDGNDVSDLISFVSFGLNTATGKYEAVVFFTEPLSAGVFVLTANGTSTITDLFGNALDGNFDGTPGGDFSRTFEVPPALGDEFQVNTFTTGTQRTYPESPQSVAMDADGDFVVTWSSFGQDGNFYGVYAQRYNAAGLAQGSEFQVNTFTTDQQFFSTVAMDADGDFVVTWTSGGQDDGYGIYAQRFNAAGVAQGSEFQVNTFTPGNQRFSTVAMDTDGDFVVTWSSRGQEGDDYGIYAQRYNAAGVAQGSEFQVLTFTTGHQRFSTVAMDADGDFIVTWSSDGQDGSGYGVFAQRYNAAGVAQGGEFQVNNFTTGQQRFSTVAMDADGDFVVTWSSYGQDGSDDGIYAQRYNAAGVAQGGEFQVHTFTTVGQVLSTVAMDADGDFVVTWSSLGQDGSNYGVFAQRYNAAGVAQGGEFQVNTFTTGFQALSTVAMDADGDFVVTWSSLGQDGGSYGIYAQRYGFTNAPTDITLAPGAVAENEPAGTVVGTLTASDVDSPETFTYALVSGTGDDDNASFQIVGDQLQTAASFNFEAGAMKSIRVQVTDADGLTFEKAIAIAIDDVNETPTAFGISPTITEDIPLNGGLLWAFDPETPIDSLIFEISTPATNGTVVRTGVRGFNYIPQANFNGMDSFQFTASDGVNTSAPATVSITVTSVNDAPNAAPISPVIDEDTPLIGGLLWAFDVETPINSLIFLVSTPPAHGTLVRTGVRGFNYTPQANFNGMDSFQFVVFDGEAISAPATVSITINPVNDTPTALPINPVINEDTPLNGGLLWAADPETPINSLVYTITVLPMHGTVTQVGVRGFNYIPEMDYNGLDAFQFTASDGVNTSAPATVAITINPVAGMPKFGESSRTFQTAAPSDGLSIALTSLTMSGTTVPTGVPSIPVTQDDNDTGIETLENPPPDRLATTAAGTFPVSPLPTIARRARKSTIGA